MYLLLVFYVLQYLFETSNIYLNIGCVIGQRQEAPRCHDPRSSPCARIRRLETGRQAGTQFSEYLPYTSLTSAAAGRRTSAALAPSSATTHGAAQSQSEAILLRAQPHSTGINSRQPGNDGAPTQHHTRAGHRVRPSRIIGGRHGRHVL